MKQKQKALRRSLWASVLAIVVCAAMLFGTTFAWFTDTVSSTGNTIQAGTLDIELTGGTGDTHTLFAGDQNILWEPGHARQVNATLTNAGNLWLKYALRVTNLTNGENDPEDVALADVLDVYVSNTEIETAEALAALTPVGTVAELADTAELEVIGVLAPDGVTDAEYDANDPLYMVVKMRETAGNEYQGKALNFDIVVDAIQYTYEEDSFGNQYDAGAYFPTDEEAVAAGQDAKVDGLYYENLASAVAAAAPQATVTLIDDTTVEKSVKVDAEDNLTIDLNDKTLEAPNGTAINMSNGGELSLVNGTVNSKGYAVYAAQDAVIHELNIDMTAEDWGVYLKDTAVLENVTGGTYKTNIANMASFPLYVGTNATIEEISGGDFQGSKAAIANYGTIKKISGGTFHGTYYDGENATIWEPSYSVMYNGNIGSITGGKFFKGTTNIAQNMTKFNAALTAGGTELVELEETATIVYNKGGNELTHTGHYYQVTPTSDAG